MNILKTLSDDSENEGKVSPKSKSQFYIVGIGASAGGLEALEQFFQNMPVKNGMSFVVIQHLDPNHIGIMPELLSRITSMKVNQATDKMKVKPDCVYVIPPNKSMSILKGELYLFDPVEPRGLRLPIDIFLRSLAIDQQEKSIGIILSGMGSDGTLGVKAIKEYNGLVLVQEPGSAKFDGMPCSASQAVIADVVAPADQLPERLMALLKYFDTAKTEPPLDNKNKSNIDKIIILLREHVGHDFSSYKKSTLFRRIERRKGIHQIEKISNYVRFLQENPKETEILFKEILIGVTSFFRDPEVWEKLIENVFPALIEEAPNGYVFRAWVTGCSTGEEAYTLAIAFKEAMEKGKQHKSLSIQIFATDLDSDAVEIARKGIFPPNIVADISHDRLSRFFNVIPSGYQINTLIREMVIKDPPFTKLDILTCRNVLIYMESDLQKKLISLFHYSLNPGGVMVLGTAESIGNDKNVFVEADNKLKIYKRTMSSVIPDLVDFPSSFYSLKKTNVEHKRILKVNENLQSLTEQILLQRFAPSSVLTSSKGDILYITGRIGKYLEPAAGKANWNIFAMAREGLSDLLPGIFRKALLSYEPLQLHNVKIGTNGATQFADITVQCMEGPETLRGMVLIVFSDIPVVVDPDSGHPKSGKRIASARQKELENELQHSQEDIQSLREEMQTSQEELKSTKEELQSTNEELQSTNEELTTSKEEMQSLNEELQTVNIELQSKIADYGRANDDMKNLLNSTEIATLFIDKELNIRRYTDQVTSIFKLRTTDIGRPFTDLVSDLNYPEIAIHARQVLKSLSSIETAISTNDNRWFNVRIMPYRTLDDRIDGLVMTFTNITLSKTLEIELKKANEELMEVRKRE